VRVGGGDSFLFSFPCESVDYRQLLSFAGCYHLHRVAGDPGDRGLEKMLFGNLKKVEINFACTYYIDTYFCKKKFKKIRLYATYTKIIKCLNDTIMIGFVLFE
jgi:hypothetical protein